MDNVYNYTFIEKFLWNFYIADLKKTTFENENEVPNFVDLIVPIFFTLITLEHVILIARGKEGIRLGDGITSISLGLFMESFKIFTKGIELMGYQWLYQRRVFDLDWQSPWTWWAAAIGVDFCYYWAHRTSHEINLFWSGHQVHHSSEEYNMTTALRQSAFQRLFGFGIYQPLALLGIPLPAMMVHFQFNLFYQFWIHTELISNLGPLEWVFNTASHHRVHHGTNKWCLDKNYAGFLIIWDRMFGTFEPERKDETIVYGLVDQPQRFENFYLQLFYFKKVFEKAASMTTWKDTLKATFYGPGWVPGSPRLGDENALPDKPLPRKKYDPQLSFWMETYVVVHFFVCLIISQEGARLYSTFTWYTALGFIIFVFFSLFTLGSFYDGQWWAPAFEALRCIATVATIKSGAFQEWGILGHPYVTMGLLGYFALSSLFWCTQVSTLLDVGGGKMKQY